MIIKGALVLAEDRAAVVAQTGRCAGWKAGSAGGRCLINCSGRMAQFLIAGDRAWRPHHDGSGRAGPRDAPTGGEGR